MDKTVVGQVTTQHNKVEKLTPYLRIQSPNNESRQIRLENKKMSIGRSKNCDIQLDDDIVSREHCCVWVDENEKINILDLGSTNGTKIDGNNIQHAFLSPNNRLKLGTHIIKLEYKDSEEIHQEELLKVAATSDPLTGISNRKWFENRVDQIIESLVGQEKHIAIVMVDIDHFKHVNDTHGHQTGDVVIKGVAEILKSSIRQQDLLARYGGEEFILCLTDSKSENTINFCERVRQKIAATKFRFGQQEIDITISLGGCAKQIDARSNLTDMIQIADKALYQSKHAGRNQTTLTDKASE